ncbi:MAG TPA: penicillin-binding protein 2 [Dehalococcoidia bacterium]|nr:penicillin-binding protein 2 [Dehalococcoidia bacterium]
MGVLTNRRRRWRSEYTEAADPRQQINRKLWVMRFAIVLAFAALVVQLARLQIVDGAQYRQRAALNQIRIEPVSPSRGLIYDRNGVPVVQNVPSFSAVAIAADIPKPREVAIAGGLQQLTGVPALETIMKIEQARQSNDPFAPVTIKDGMTADETFHLREQLAELPGVQVAVQPVRQYTGGPELSDILGYTGRVDPQDYATLKGKGYLASDYLGKAGVEAAYESYLRGLPGRQEVEKDATGRQIRVLGTQPAQPGDSLKLSIDLDLQKKVAQLLAATPNGGQAAAVVMDVHTGEVLALVSLPFYDNNVLSGKINETTLEQYLHDPNKPLVNHALAEQYAPGSIFKQITGTAALQEGVATPSTTILANGYINVPNDYDPSIVYTFRDWNTFGPLNFYGGVANSSDVYFYYLAGGYHAYGQNFNGLGIDRLVKYAGYYGIGRKTGIDIAGEADGVLPSPAWKKATFGDDWRLGDTYNMGIGQGFVAATPIQMVRITAAVANGGTLFTPRVVSEVRDAQGHIVVPNEPKIESHIPVTAANFAVMRDAMAQAVLWGSAHPAFEPDLKIAGKTGTAEFGPRHPDGSYDTHAWFSGFAPADNPQIAVTVFLLNGVGATNAAPLGAKILDYYLHRPQPQTAAAPPSGDILPGSAP